MANQIEPEARQRIEYAVRKLAGMDYPRVWIGEEGMTADELLDLQMLNDEGPEWMRVDPGELVQVEGDEEEEERGGLRMPEVSHHWLDGLWVYENMPRALPGHVLAELEAEVLHVFAAKQGMVLVQTLLKEREDISQRHREPLDGLAVARHFDPDSDAPGYTLLVRLVPLDGLTPDDVNEELIDALEFYSDGASGIPYVIEDTDQARRALEERLNS